MWLARGVCFNLLYLSCHREKLQEGVRDRRPEENGKQRSTQDCLSESWVVIPSTWAGQTDHVQTNAIKCRSHRYKCRLELGNSVLHLANTNLYHIIKATFKGRYHVWVCQLTPNNRRWNSEAALRAADNATTTSTAGAKLILPLMSMRTVWFVSGLSTIFPWFPSRIYTGRTTHIVYRQDFVYILLPNCTIQGA